METGVCHCGHLQRLALVHLVYTTGERLRTDLYLAIERTRYVEGHVYFFHAWIRRITPLFKLIIKRYFLVCQPRGQDVEISLLRRIPMLVLANVFSICLELGQLIITLSLGFDKELRARLDRRTRCALDYVSPARIEDRHLPFLIVGVLKGDLYQLLLFKAMGYRDILCPHGAEI